MDTAPLPPPVAEDKTVAILSYLTLIGLIAAILIHSGKKTQLGAFHLRQSLGLMLTSMVAGVAVSVLIMITTLALSFIHFLAVILYPVMWLAFVGTMIGLWIMGLLAAIQGEMKPLPVVGPLYQKWLGTAFE
jgi:uncharacterized membrane protein